MGVYSLQSRGDPESGGIGVAKSRFGALFSSLQSAVSSLHSADRKSRFGALFSSLQSAVSSLHSADRKSRFGALFSSLQSAVCDFRSAVVGHQPSACRLRRDGKLTQRGHITSACAEMADRRRDGISRAVLVPILPAANAACAFESVSSRTTRPSSVLNLSDFFH